MRIIRCIANISAFILFEILGMSCIFFSAEIFHSAWYNPVQGLDWLSDFVQFGAVGSFMIIFGATLCVFGIEYVIPLES